MKITKFVKAAHGGYKVIKSAKDTLSSPVRVAGKKLFQAIAIELAKTVVLAQLKPQLEKLDNRPFVDKHFSIPMPAKSMGWFKENTELFDFFCNIVCDTINSPVELMNRKITHIEMKPSHTQNSIDCRIKLEFISMDEPTKADAGAADKKSASTTPEHTSQSATSRAAAQEDISAQLQKNAPLSQTQVGIPSSVAIKAKKIVKKVTTPIAVPTGDNTVTKKAPRKTTTTKSAVAEPADTQDKSTVSKIKEKRAASKSLDAGAQKGVEVEAKIAKTQLNAKIKGNRQTKPKITK